MPYKDKEKQLECQRKHYRNHKDYYLRRNKIRRDHFFQIILKAKDVPCADCGGRFPSCAMDFDHKRDKKFSISHRHRIHSEKHLQEEMDKCDVVCANCHRIRTQKRNQFPDSVNVNMPDFESGESTLES